MCEYFLGRRSHIATYLMSGVGCDDRVHAQDLGAPTLALDFYLHTMVDALDMNVRPVASHGEASDSLWGPLFGTGCYINIDWDATEAVEGEPVDTTGVDPSGFGVKLGEAFFAKDNNGFVMTSNWQILDNHSVHFQRGRRGIDEGADAFYTRDVVIPNNAGTLGATITGQNLTA